MVCVIYWDLTQLPIYKVIDPSLEELHDWGE